MSYGKLVLGFVFACSQAPEENGVVSSAIGGNQSTHIRVKGKAVQAFLGVGDLHGFVNASKDDLTGTSALDFAWAVPSPTNPDLFTFTQGAGPIPNTAFSVSSTAATLNVTTSFPINVCIVNTITLETTCSTGSPIAFDLAWAADGFETSFTHFNAMSTFGPFTSHVIGNADTYSAGVNGTITGYTVTDNIGTLLDTKNHTINRDVTF